MTDFPAAEPGQLPPARRVYLHVGAPKTGTTFLQAMLGAHREQLLQDGCLYPVTKSAAHHLEARDLRSARPRRGYVHPSGPGSWERLVRRIQDWDGSGIALVSSELLVVARPPHIEHAFRSLRPAEVHVVVTVRDLVRQVPAVWQETVKNGSTTTYDDFLRRLVEDEEGPGRGFWNGQDPVRVLDRWAGGLPPDRVHLVTVPPPGSDPRLLWTRFASVLGVDPEAYPSVPTRANTSLGVAETEAVRRINAQVSQAPWQFYSKHIKRGIAEGVLAGRSDSARLLLPEELLPLVEQRTKRIVDTLTSRRYDVVGDLDDLLPPRDGRGVGSVPEPDLERLAEASAVAADYLAGTFAKVWQRAQKSATEGASGRPGTSPSPAGRAGGAPFVGRLRRGYRSVRGSVGRSVRSVRGRWRG
jgi:hypothetical protein